MARRVRQGEIGKLCKLITVGYSGGHVDPPRGATIENRRMRNIWRQPHRAGAAAPSSVSTSTPSTLRRGCSGSVPSPLRGLADLPADPHSDGADAGGVVYEYADGLIHEHSGQHLPNGVPGELSCKLFGLGGYAVVNYWQQTPSCYPRGRKPITGTVNSLYPNGASRNIATFYDCITRGKCDNPTVPRAVDARLDLYPRP